MLPGTAQPRGQGPDVAETDTSPGTGKVAGDTAATAFISKWQGVAASELSTSQSFLIDLCHLLGVDTRPNFCKCLWRWVGHRSRTAGLERYSVHRRRCGIN